MDGYSPRFQRVAIGLRTEFGKTQKLEVESAKKITEDGAEALIDEKVKAKAEEIVSEEFLVKK